MTFDDLGLIPEILEALKAEGYTTPTPIQAQSIPALLQKRDLLGCAQTGTGKTAAFAIPIIQLLHAKVAAEKGRKTIKALILTPTRELATQIVDSFDAYGKKCHLKSTVVFGGVSQKSQTDTLARGIDVLVATPGRLLDLINQGFISLQHIEFFVLDEADRMLDMGFVHDVKKLITKLPAKRQSLFFSATMPPEIQKLADTILVNPVKVEVTPVSSTAEKVEQAIYFVEKPKKKALLLHVLKEKDFASILVFSRTKHGADKVVKDLIGANITAEAIHGNKSQNARQRALSNFKSKITRVLVATDIAARGIDIDDLPLVINYELPNEPETYVHRIGRTGRAGASGIALSFCDQEEREYLRLIQKLITKTLPVVDNHPYLPEDPRFFIDTIAPSKTSSEQRRSGGGGRPSNGRPSGGNRPPSSNSAPRDRDRGSWGKKK